MLHSRAPAVHDVEVAEVAAEDALDCVVDTVTAKLVLETAELELLFAVELFLTDVEVVDATAVVFFFTTELVEDTVVATELLDTVELLACAIELEDTVELPTFAAELEDADVVLEVEATAFELELETVAFELELEAVTLELELELETVDLLEAMIALDEVVFAVDTAEDVTEVALVLLLTTTDDDALVEVDAAVEVEEAVVPADRVTELDSPAS